MTPVLGRLGSCDVAVSDGDGDGGALALTLGLVVAVDEVNGLAVAWALEQADAGAGDDGIGGCADGTAGAVAVDIMVQGVCVWVVSRFDAGGQRVVGR